MNRGFGSDNHSGAHPRILEAITRANAGHAPSYGTDEFSNEASELMKRLFGPATETFFVFNGTAANVLALSACVRPHQIIFAAAQAHIENDECGAPERLLGAKIRALPTPDGKLTPEMIRPFLVRKGDQHASQPRVISITQPTEIGTVYVPGDITALSEFAKENGMLLHMDGARLVNAAASLDLSLKALTTDCGVDVVSFGGTKNGLLFGEAVLFLREGLSGEFKYVRKQLMQLPSKTRFIAAQFLELLGTDLWKQNARHSVRMARLLADGLKGSPYAQITQKTEANSVFVRLPRKLVSRLRETSFFYVWDEHTFECRLVCSWDTQESDVEAFLARLKKLGDEHPELAYI